MDQHEELGFIYRVRKSGAVVIERNHTLVTTLRGRAAERFIRDVQQGDPQQVMARVTGQYRRGNERAVESHPRNR